MEQLDVRWLDDLLNRVAIRDIISNSDGFKSTVESCKIALNTLRKLRKRRVDLRAEDDDDDDDDEEEKKKRGLHTMDIFAFERARSIIIFIHLQSFQCHFGNLSLKFPNR